MANSSTPTKKPRTFTGVVVSVKTKHTAVVQVDRAAIHPKYGKRYFVSRKYHVHDPAAASQVGEKVTFVETRPLSATKRWRLSQTAR
jgi:small subunit ribosomal protein S17